MICLYFASTLHLLTLSPFYRFLPGYSKLLFFQNHLSALAKFITTLEHVLTGLAICIYSTRNMYF